MYLPRAQIAQLYAHLERSAHLQAKVAILTALTVDALCAARILEALFRQQCIQHHTVPISGYADLQAKGAAVVRPMTRRAGGAGGTVICLGLGGAVALEEILGLERRADDGGDAVRDHGVEVWVVDAHRPLNLENVFGGTPATSPRLGITDGRIDAAYQPGRGGVVVWDDGDLDDELRAEKEAYFALQAMPDITEDDLVSHDGDEDDDGDEEPPPGDEDIDDTSSSIGQKRKRGRASDDDDDDDVDASDSDAGHGRAPRRRRRDSSTSVPIPSSPGGNPLSAQLDGASALPTLPSSPPQRKELSARQMRRQLLKLRRKHEATLDKHYDLGTSSAEPVSSMMYSLASELGREDNDMLWLAAVGISSLQILPSGAGARIRRVKELLQDEVRRLNPIPEAELRASQSAEARIPTGARKPDDRSIRLSPEPRFMMIRHWSLYDAMQHSPYLATRLHLWSEAGKKRLHKLLAKMGISLQEAGKGFTHMDSELKHSLRKRILKFAEQYNLADLVPANNSRSMDGWGFVRSMGYGGTFSAEDIAIVVGALLEVGGEHHLFPELKFEHRPTTDFNYNARMRNLPTPPHSSDDGLDGGTDDAPDYVEHRFNRAYDALAQSSRGFRAIERAIPVAQKLSRAILRVGSHIISKNLIRHLRGFRMAIVKEGPDVPLFTHPGALTRLAAWLGEACTVLQAEQGTRVRAGHDDALVVAALDEARHAYVVVGLGGGEHGVAGGTKFRSKAEIQARADQKKTREAARTARHAAAQRRRDERARLRRDRNAANGLLSDEDESESDVDDTEEEEEDDDDDDDDSDAESQPGPARRNRFGHAFQEVVDQTGARVRIDSFEHSVVDVRKDDFSAFLEALSFKTVLA